MGNLCSGGNGGSKDQEHDIAMSMSLAKAASTGARDGVVDAFRVPGQVQQSAHQGALIGGLPPVAIAQEAAAAGAERALDDMMKKLNFARRFGSNLKQVKIAAGYGAKVGLEEVEQMVTRSDIEVHGVKMINLDVAAAAAATGARVACFISAQKLLTPNSSKYTALLGPMFGGSFPTSVAVYNLLTNSTDVVKLCGFGGVTLAVFVISSGLAAGMLGTTPGSACYTRFATLAAVTIVLSLFTLALCTIFSSVPYKAACGAICGLLIMILVIIWLVSGW
ncbi:hypothetical protein C2845_PM03G20740 [Panicum miliaceum]|uniref:Uncharacterized protein n=1 Tax=Panicum miliaceum TaxID=4540 RepID=A0A3L6TF14_PANMI|nr:hypothetical protein C2845_PM03G20740 [Panicum miliaceum]